VAALSGGCVLRQARPPAETPVVLLAAFVDTRALLGPDTRIVVGAYQLSPDTVPHLWAASELKPILADTSVRLADPTGRARTLEERPFPWSAGPGAVGVSFSVPEFRNDTARVLVATVAQLQESSVRTLARLILVRRAGRWIVVRREQLLTS
jgi:hypothetical protein